MSCITIQLLVYLFNTVKNKRERQAAIDAIDANLLMRMLLFGIF